MLQFSEKYLSQLSKKFFSYLNRCVHVILQGILYTDCLWSCQMIWVTSLKINPLSVIQLAKLIPQANKTLPHKRTGWKYIY